MYAVVKTGGKQYRVTPGQRIKLETLTAEVGDVVDFDEILMVSHDGQVSVGTPHISGGKVSAKVLSHGRGKKIDIIKFKRRKHHMKHMGHRQNYTEVEIIEICENA